MKRLLIILSLLLPMLAIAQPTNNLTRLGSGAYSWTIGGTNYVIFSNGPTGTVVCIGGICLTNWPASSSGGGSKTNGVSSIGAGSNTLTVAISGLTTNALVQVSQIMTTNLLTSLAVSVTNNSFTVKASGSAPTNGWKVLWNILNL